MMIASGGLTCRMLWPIAVCLLACALNAAGLQLATQARQDLMSPERTKNFEMTCPVSGVMGQVYYRWQYSPAMHLTPGNEIVQSPQHTIRSDSLIISEVTKTDAGFYTASVTDNSRRIVRCMFQLTVGYGPELVDVVPTTVTANFSRPFILTCPVRGVPLPHVIWRKNGRTLAPSANVQFDGLDISFASVSDSDRGQYQCSATNPFGTVTSPVTIINIQWPLRFVEIPPSVLDMAEGQNISVQCNVTGFPHARILWYKINGSDSEQISNSSHMVITNMYSERVSWSRLDIDALNVSDNGMYRCEATNVNQQISTNFDLVVHAPPRITSVHPAIRTVHVGMEVVFECSATGFPPPKFTWFMNERAIPRIGNTHFHEGWDGILTIDRVIEADAGNYTCQAFNDIGYEYSDTTRLDVFGIYFRERAPPVVAVEEGNSTELVCDVGGADYGVRIEWFKNRTPIQSQCTPRQADSLPRCKYMIMNNTLTILRVSQRDLGTYVCRATEQGKADPDVIRAETKVLFAAPVVIYPRLKDVHTGDAGQPLTLECKAKGSPPPTVEWLYRGLHLLNDSHRLISGGTIKFRRLIARDSGHYLCVASNNITEARQDIRIKVNSAPPMLNLKLKHSGRSVTLDWNVVGNGGYPVTSFKYEYRIISPKTGKWSRDKLPPNMRSHTIKGLRSNATYELKMWASNKLGQGTILRQVFSTDSYGEGGLSNIFSGLSEDNLRLIYIGAGVAGGLFLLILVVVFAIACKRKPDPAGIRSESIGNAVPRVTIQYKSFPSFRQTERADGIEDGEALVDGFHESPSHINPAYGGSDNITSENLELQDVNPSDSNGITDKNGKPIAGTSDANGTANDSGL
nr:cell adhesion molecule DSCAM-like isoform X1 [Lytechinus pictus]